jgi:hypothetical protein
VREGRIYAFLLIDLQLNYIDRHKQSKGEGGEERRHKRVSFAHNVRLSLYDTFDATHIRSILLIFLKAFMQAVTTHKLIYFRDTLNL